MTEETKCIYDLRFMIDESFVSLDFARYSFTIHRSKFTIYNLFLCRSLIEPRETPLCLWGGVATWPDLNGYKQFSRFPTVGPYNVGCSGFMCYVRRAD